MDPLLLLPEDVKTAGDVPSLTFGWFLGCVAGLNLHGGDASLHAARINRHFYNISTKDKRPDIPDKTEATLSYFITEFFNVSLYVHF